MIISQWHWRVVYGSHSSDILNCIGYNLILDYWYECCNTIKSFNIKYLFFSENIIFSSTHTNNPLAFYTIVFRSFYFYFIFSILLSIIWWRFYLHFSYIWEHSHLNRCKSMIKKCVVFRCTQVRHTGSLQYSVRYLDGCPAVKECLLVLLTLDWLPMCYVIVLTIYFYPCIT